MPLNVRRIFASFSLVLFAFIFTYSQTTNAVSQNSTATTQTAVAPTAAEVMRERIQKAKAYIVVKNYNAAIYELENIRRETNDPNIHAMLNVLLMNSYLEQADYKRAQTMLADLYKDLKANKPNAVTNYYSVAGQVVKGAKNQLERYRAIGLSVADRNLPLEALVDIDKMRETLEAVIEQSKTLGADKKQTENALPILEEATNARSALAKDDYDANRWRQETTDAREMMVNSRSTIINAVDGTTESVAQNAVALNTVSTGTTNPPPTNIKAPETKTASQPANTPITNQNLPSDVTLKPVDKTPEKIVEKQEIPKETGKSDEAPKQTETAAKIDSKQPIKQQVPVNSSETRTPSIAKNEETKAEASPNTAPADAVKTDSMMAVGSLLEFATKRVNPVYPSMARSMRLSGVVRVEVTIDESGNVAEVQKTDGPSLLQRAAVDAVKKWQFKPFTRDGQPTRATGFVNFNFSL